MKTRATTHKQLGDMFTAIGYEARAALTPPGAERDALLEHAASYRVGGEAAPSFVAEAFSDDVA